MALTDYFVNVNKNYQSCIYTFPLLSYFALIRVIFGVFDSQRKAVYASKEVKNTLFLLAVRKKRKIFQGFAVLRLANCRELTYFATNNPND